MDEHESRELLEQVTVGRVSVVRSSKRWSLEGARERIPLPAQSHEVNHPRIS
jgi:hypothetical protein